MKACIYCKDQILWNSPVYWFASGQIMLHTKCFEPFAREYPLSYRQLMEANDLDRHYDSLATEWITGT